MRKNGKTKILIVDDTPETLLSLENIVAPLDVDIITADSGQKALERLTEHDAAMVVLDVQMPGMDGFETARRMGESDKTRNIPFILVTGTRTRSEDIIKGYAIGAIDYLIKPLDAQIMRNKIEVFLELHDRKKGIEPSKAELEKTVLELKKANKKILEQQKSVIEEERLKVLLQMAGATAHELNQPLMALLGNIQLLELDGDLSGDTATRIGKINAAGKKIANIVKKIQTIRHDESKTYTSGSAILNIDQEISILSVEDTDADYQKLTDILKTDSQVSLERAVSVKQGLAMVSEGNFDMVFLDYMLPDGNGMDFLNGLSEKNLETPVVIITGQGDELIASKIIQKGAYDYLPKSSVSVKALSRIIPNTLEKAGLRKEMKMVQTKLTEMSTRDELTSLFNRRYFMEALEREISGVSRYGHLLSLFIVDIDFFKKINDKHGHPCGDAVLKDFSELLGDSVRKYDIACRYGGEEFAVILPDTSAEKAVSLCGRFRKKIEQHTFEYDDLKLKITASIGVASGRCGRDPLGENLINSADKALYKAKNQGRNQVVVGAGVS